MSNSLVVRSQGQVLGTITLDGDQLVGSSPEMQEIADVTRARFSTASRAYDSLLNTNNGYASFYEADADCVGKVSGGGSVTFGPPR